MGVKDVNYSNILVGGAFRVYLMLMNTEVLRFDIDGVVEVLAEHLLPYPLRGVFKDGDNQHNVKKVLSWLSSRVMLSSRDNADKLSMVFGMPVTSNIMDRAKLCMRYRGVSVTDSYWLCEDRDLIRGRKHWFDVNPRKHRPMDLVSVGLYGENPKSKYQGVCLEVTTSGRFKKAWSYEGKKLYLLKSDKTSDFVHTKMEVLASKILNCFDGKLLHVRYTGRYRNTSFGRMYVNKCENFMVKENKSFVRAEDILCNAERLGINIGASPQLACIPVLDFILGNTDRNTDNWGWLMDNYSGRLTEYAPLFDFNCALIGDYFGRDVSSTLSPMFNDGSTLVGLAERYIRYSQVCLDRYEWEELYKREKEYRFILDRVYERACYLGVVD